MYINDMLRQWLAGQICH